MKIHRLFAGLSCAVILLAGAGCGGKTPGTSDISGTGTPARPIPPPHHRTRNRPASRTGCPACTIWMLGEDNRPFAFMIGNNDRSRPQVGLDKADPVEAKPGGITRIMAVFAERRTRTGTASHLAQRPHAVCHARTVPRRHCIMPAAAIWDSNHRSAGHRPY